MDPSLSSRKIEASPEVLVQEIDGEAALLDLKTGRYFGLDDVGTRIWTLLIECESVETALESLLEEYDVSRERLEGEVGALLDKLVSRGLVEVADA